MMISNSDRVEANSVSSRTEKVALDIDTGITFHQSRDMEFTVSDSDNGCGTWRTELVHLRRLGTMTILTLLSMIVGSSCPGLHGAALQLELGERQMVSARSSTATCCR
jgi:hypothetical protein